MNDQSLNNHGAQGLVCDGFLTLAVNSNGGLTFEPVKNVKIMVVRYHVI